MILYRLCDPDASKFDHENILKSITIYTDMLSSEMRLEDGYISIFDMSNYGLSHLAKLKLHLIKFSCQYYQV